MVIELWEKTARGPKDVAQQHAGQVTDLEGTQRDQAQLHVKRLTHLCEL